MPVLKEMRAALLLPMELPARDEADARRKADQWEKLDYVAYPVSLPAPKKQKGGKLALVWNWFCRVEGQVDHDIAD